MALFVDLHTPMFDPAMLLVENFLTTMLALLCFQLIGGLLLIIGGANIVHRFQRLFTQAALGLGFGVLIFANIKTGGATILNGLVIPLVLAAGFSLSSISIRKNKNWRGLFRDSVLILKTVAFPVFLIIALRLAFSGAGFGLPLNVYNDYVTYAKIAE